MQTPAEAVLIERTCTLLKALDPAQRTVLNVGAGQSTLLEDVIAGRLGPDSGFGSDRLDIEDCAVKHPFVRRSIVQSVEDMTQVPSSHYALVTSNYVFEHVPDCRSALSEVSRVLRPGGHFVFTVPNPSAPEFLVARYTPTWFHERVKGRHEGASRSYPTFYNYGSLAGLVRAGLASGLEVHDTFQASFLWGYLARWRLLDLVGRAWDQVVNGLELRRFQGHVCMTLRKGQG
jgi:SAM-dependent methyltransferase